VAQEHSVPGVVERSDIEVKAILLWIHVDGLLDGFMDHDPLGIRTASRVQRRRR